MRKARLTEHQIIAILKSVEAGRTVKDVCRETGISEASYYNREAGFPFRLYPGIFYDYFRKRLTSINPRK